MRKHIFILTIILIILVFPAYAFAEDEASQPEAAVSESYVIEGGHWSEDGNSYFDANGRMLTYCVESIDGRLYYFNFLGVKETFSGWKYVNNNSYWADSNSVIASSPVKIKEGNKSNVYMFGTDGRLIESKGLFKYEGKEYYGLGDGRLKTGWVAANNKAMYFNKKSGKTGTLGSMVKGKKIGYLKIPKSGRLGKAYALGIKQLNKSGWSLRKAYNYSAGLKYKGRFFRTTSSEKYALRGFTKGYGNCYVMAGTFYIQAKLLGYNVHHIEGRVWGPHSWTVIKHGKKWYVYDPNCTNEVGINAYRIWYGKKGTWKYKDYHRIDK